MNHERQHDIGFEHKDRSDFALVRSLTSIRDSGIGNRRLNGVRRLLETLLVCSTDYVSYARETVIANKAVGGPVTDRTVRNWIRDAKALGVLSIDPRPGQATSAKRIELNRLRELVRPSSRQEKSSGRQEMNSGRQEIISSLRVSPLEGPFGSPPPPPTTIEAQRSESTIAVEVEEDDLMGKARALGLYDVNAVNIARAHGWTDIQLRQLFAEFEQRRKRWGETIRNPCGLLRTWLHTLRPVDPIPWPDTEPRSTKRREPSNFERAKQFVMKRRKELQDDGCEWELIERTIRSELQERKASAELCRAVGYSIDSG